MKILVLNFEYPPIGGGASPVCARICEELAARDHQVTVVTMGLPGLAVNEIKNNVQIHRISVGRKQKNMSYPSEHLRYISKGRRFIKSLLQKESFDIIHCHFILSSGILARFIWKKYRIPYVLTAHGSDLPHYNPDRFKGIHLLTPIWIRKVLRDGFAVTAPSHFLSRLIFPYLDERNKFKFIPNGIDFMEQPYHKKEKIILSTGRLLKRKGFSTLIQAIKDLETNFEVHICGDGPEMEALKKLSEGTLTKIVFHGWLDNTSSTYRGLLERASIYCLVSELENASISILEAMANGCAVITSDESGTAEMVQETGLLVPPNDVKSLQASITKLIKDKDLTQRLGVKAKHRVKEMYTWQGIVDQYESLLHEAISHP